MSEMTEAAGITTLLTPSDAAVEATQSNGSNRLLGHPIDPADSLPIPQKPGLVSDEVQELPADLMNSGGYKSTFHQEHSERESYKSETRVKPPPYPASYDRDEPSIGLSSPPPSIVDHTSFHIPSTPPSRSKQTSSDIQSSLHLQKPYHLPEEAKPAAPSPAAPTVTGSMEVQRRDAAAAAVRSRERDVAAAAAALPKVSPHWTHHYMKLLLVGEDGLGRTTFVRNLFAAYAEAPNFPVADASGLGARNVFLEAPERLCTELVVADEHSMVVWHYLVQDTPGFGDVETVEDLDADRDNVLDHIRYCSTQYLEQELDPSRRATLETVVDTRVDVCLYFLPPHRLRKMDVRFIKQLSGLVPVVPILSKADTFTPEELAAFRATVRQSLDMATSSAWRFSQETLNTAGAPAGPPFAVIGSNVVDSQVGRFWPVRRYPWGRCESLLTAHSELPVLRRLLFEAGYWELKQHTNDSYLEFREKEVGVRGSIVPKPFHGLVRLAVGSVAVVAASLLLVNVGPYLRSPLTRQIAVRRVKAKVGEAVESAIDTVQEVQGRATEVGKVAHDTAKGAVSGTRIAFKAAARAVESDAARAQREAKEARARRTWWKFWGQSLE